MTDVYENCPVFENDSYILRMTSQEDKSDLLKVLSDGRLYQKKPMRQ